MVAGLVHTGVIEALGAAAVSAFGDNWFLAATALIFGSAILGAFIDNIPYTATMTPVVEEMAAQIPDVETGRAHWWSFALGVGFGGYGTASLPVPTSLRSASHNGPAGHPSPFGDSRNSACRHPVERHPRVGIRVAALLLKPGHQPAIYDERANRDRVLASRSQAIGCNPPHSERGTGQPDWQPLPVVLAWRPPLLMVNVLACFLLPEAPSPA